MLTTIQWLIHLRIIIPVRHTRLPLNDPKKESPTMPSGTELSPKLKYHIYILTQLQVLRIHK